MTHAPALHLHLATVEQWREHLRTGVIAPSVAPFVHLSAPEQVALPANRLFAGRDDVVLLVIDPDRVGVEVRWEPGLPTDPDGMRFPHAYGPVPTGAVLAVLPYRAGADGVFTAPQLPAVDVGSRHAAFDRSLLRRTATREVPVVGGVAVLTERVPRSFLHNQLLITEPVDAALVVAEADRVLGGAGLDHRTAVLWGDALAGTAAALTSHDWTVQPLLAMAAAAGGPPAAGVVVHGPEGDPQLREAWADHWRRELPDPSAEEIGQLADRYALEDAVTRLEHLAVHVDDEVVAWCTLRIDGATAQVDALNTVSDHRRRGLGDALLAHARHRAGEAGCDLLVLEAAAGDWPRLWYARRGFVRVGRVWTAGRP